MSTDSNWRTNVGQNLEDTATGLLDRIPGYRGYRDKEGRRDADRLVRVEIAAALERQAERVLAVAGGLADKRRITEVGPVTSLADAIRHLADRVRTASYGYAPLFSDRKIDAAALDQLRRFDEGLMAGIDDLSAPLASLESASSGNGDLDPPVRDGNAAIRTLNARLDLRNQVMTTGDPASEESVVAVLATEPPPAPHPAFSLNSGDAVSVLGDDFVVDARIDIVAGEQSIRLFRLHTGPPGRWLLVPLDPTLSFADLSERATTDETSSRDVETTGSGTGEIAGSADASAPRAVRFRIASDGQEMGIRSVELNWGTESQSFAGKGVHPDDIEVFGATATP